MNPERKVEIQLWDWLKTSYNSKIQEVYFNSKNELNAPIFKVKGSLKKPDLIIKHNNEYTAVEVKDNSSSLNILKADKIIDFYYKEYTENKSRYFIEDKEIFINNFVIATQSSKNGVLFKNEILIDNWDSDPSSSKYKVSKEYKIIPRMEGNRTFEFIRQLWNNFSKIRNDYETKAAIGILIANTENELNPYLMVSKFNYKIKRWSQKWMKL